MGLVRWSKELSSNPNVCGYFLQGILRMRLWWNYRLVKIDFSILIQLLQQFLDKEFSDSSIFGSAHPVSIIKSVIQRMLLFTWWSGFWFYEGTSVSLVSKSDKLSCARANMKFLVRENEHTGSDEKSKRKWAFLSNYPLFPVRALTSFALSKLLGI